MANISSAYGHLTISEEVWDGIAGTFYDYIEHYAAPYYGVVYWDIEYSDEHETLIRFDGAGRWAFDSCIQDVDWFFNTEKNPLAKKIIDHFIKCGDDAVQYEYVDEEAGCDVLYEAWGSSYVSEGKLFFGFESKDYEYTSRNLLNLGIYDDDYCEDIVSLIEEVQLNVAFPLTDEAKEYIRSEFFDGRHDGAMLGYEIDNLIWEVSHDYAPNSNQLSLMG